MTAQAADSLVYHGECLGLCEELLAPYFELLGEKPQFVARTTALWRGYIAEWEILDDRLYLVGLRVWVKGYKEVGLSYLFPDNPDRVFAYWVSGAKRATAGKQLRYVHGGFGSIYERDLYLDFSMGVLSRVVTKQNDAKDLGTSPDLVGMKGQIFAQMVRDRRSQ